MRVLVGAKLVDVCSPQIQCISILSKLPNPIPPMVVGPGRETVAWLLQGSTTRDQLLVQTSDSFTGLLLFAIGLLLFMVAFVEKVVRRKILIR
ncbi:hypothetical protein MUK42_05828 [Musa troglodytarum]|uniref:DUF7865 domain-containing protein n=1 Tax=Musa troglodytarum TaxID=320322 RepID=A0A9E7JZN0_9LILI|nr:hypothetical protein MUK42_05828 [Musa troglodytarum]